MPFVFGGVIAEPGRIEIALLILILIITLSSIAFPACFGREVMKDIADVKGDALRNIRSVARIYGVEKAMRITVFSYSIAVMLSAVPFFLVNTSYFFNPAYIYSPCYGRIYFAPCDVVLSEEDIVQPDIFFISKEREHIITERNIQGAPDLVIEIMSPFTAKLDKSLKLKLYERFEVKEYWLVNPDREEIETFQT